eukprot:TRINITY_DN712_c0_g4_i1.p1 TRINITY_DN712_c0_g4~~TRINITY_DN712_c0_g4_i1.p1  ORF type:complete len:697 (+),score=104.75 TRINITY_DN712_c0_g4_i1:45-2135(+)
MTTRRFDSVCYCGDAPDPDVSPDVIHCWSCSEFFHARCTGIVKEREMPMAWGEYLLWKFICRKCAQQHQQPTEHIERRTGGLQNLVIGRVAVLNALRSLNLLVSFEASATPLVAVKDLINNLPASSHNTALGVAVSWEEICASIHCDDKLLVSLDGSEVGIKSVSAIFPELSWKKRMEKSSSNAMSTQIVSNAAGPAPFLLQLDSDVEVVNRKKPLFTVAEVPFNSEIAEFKNPGTSVQRTTSLHFDVVSGIYHKTYGWKVTAGTFIEVKSKRQTAVARVIDVLQLPGDDGGTGSRNKKFRRTTHFAYVQWMVSAKDIIRNWQTSEKAEPHSCSGPSGDTATKLMWLNKSTIDEFQAAYSLDSGDLIPYPKESSFVHGWLARMTELVDTVSVGSTNERFLTFDTDYVNLNNVDFKPVAVHLIPMKKQVSGCLTCCNLINQPLSTTSRWYRQQAVSFTTSHMTMFSSIAAAIVIAAFSSTSCRSLYHRYYREEPFVSNPPLCLRPDFYFTYGYNPHTGGFFALPPALRLVLELEGEYNGENLGQRMTELLKTCEADKPQTERQVMDADLEVEVTDEEIPSRAAEWGNPRLPKSRWLKGSCGFSDAKKERLDINQLDLLPLISNDDMFTSSNKNDDLWERDSSVADMDVFSYHASPETSKQLDEMILINRSEEILQTDTFRQAVITSSDGKYGSLKIE